jgi:hypothetical protein
MIYLLIAWLQVAIGAPVVFQVNDSMVKDRVVPGVEIRATLEKGGEAESLGRTDSAGRLEIDLAPGTWFVSYRADGYIPIGGSPTPIPEEGGEITTTLSMLLEAQGIVGRRRVQIVLNWGSQWSDVRDADAHLVCACDENFEVYFADKEHLRETHSANLDVDDIDWGGPETITLLDPPPGTYRYFVRNYSGPGSALGESDVVVRVLFGDTFAGEYRVPADLATEDWYPFKSLVVGEDLAPRVVPFTPEERATQADRTSRAGFRAGCSGCGLWTAIAVGLLFGAVVFIIIRRKS